MRRARFKLAYTRAHGKEHVSLDSDSCTLRPQLVEIRGQGRRVFLSQREHHVATGNVPISASMHLSGLLLLFYSSISSRACRMTVPGSVSPAIPLTRLRIVVLAREEGRRHRCMSPVVRVSAYLRWDFGAARARERKGERERTNSREHYVQRKCNGIRRVR